MTLTLKIFQIIGVILMICGVPACTERLAIMPLFWVLGIAFYTVGRMGIWLMDSGKPKVM